MFHLLLCGLLATSVPADRWPTHLFLSGNDIQRARIAVDLTNPGPAPLAGYPVALTVGRARGQVDLADRRARDIRVADGRGVEMLFDLRAPDGHRVDDGPIPPGSTLTVPCTTAAGATQRLYVYAEHPDTYPVPDFLRAPGTLLNGGFEGEGDWRLSATDTDHQLTRVRTAPHSGQWCLESRVAPGATATWVSAQQGQLAVRPGGHYRVSAWVRGEGVVGSAGWFVHVGTNTNPMVINRVVKVGDGTFDWRPVTIDFTAPPGAVGCVTGTILYGTGTAWYDDARLECLDEEASVRAAVGPVERLELAEPAARPAFAPDREVRLPIWVVNLGAALPQALVQVRATRLRPLLQRGFSEDSLRIVDARSGLALPFQWIGPDLCFSVTVPARCRLRFDAYLSRRAGAAPAPALGYAGLLDSPANLAANPSFEAGGALPEGWAPLTEGTDKPRGDLARVPGGLFGGHCLRMTTTASGAWTGWRQEHAVEPNTDYLFLAYLRTKDYADHPARIHAHLLDAAGRKQFWSGGPDHSGTTDWGLVGGRLHTGPATKSISLYLTANGRGTIEHDGVLFARVLAAEPGELECRPAPGAPAVQAWTEDALVKVFGDTPPEPAPREVALYAPRGGEVSVQLCLRASAARDDVSVRCDPPRGTGGALPEARIERVGFVPSLIPSAFDESTAQEWVRRLPSGPARTDGWCGWWPDYLAPPGDKLTLSSERTQPLWVTFAVPRDAKPGEYATTLTVAAGEATVAQVPVRLKVWPLQLPERPTLQALFDLRDGTWAPHPVLSRKDDWWRLYAARHISPDRVEPQPTFKLNGGRVVMDAGAFDRAAEVAFDQLHFTASYFPSVFYAAGWGMPPRPFLGLAPGTPEYARAYSAGIRLFWEHVKQRGWADRFSMYVSDEPYDQSPKVREDLAAVIKLTRAVDPAIPVYSSTWHPVPDWFGLLNHWGVGQYGCFPTDEMERRRAAGDKLWLTVDGQLELDTPYCACERLLSYYCFAHQLSGFEHWAMAWYTYDPYRFGWYTYLIHHFSPENTRWVRYPSGSGHLAYLGPQGEPVSTIRLENVRAGLEDYEILAALQRLRPATERDRQAVAEVFGEVQALTVIPNEGGYRSTAILPAPARLSALRVRAGELLAALGR